MLNLEGKGDRALPGKELKNLYYVHKKPVYFC